MDMTPNNIVNMARLKGLDMIAVADHNTAGQLRAVKAVADAVGVSLLPAMELTTREEAHLLAYFLTVEEAEDFSREIYEFLPPIPNRVSLFGRQAFMNEDDEIVREEEKLLISALSLSVDALAVMPSNPMNWTSGITVALSFSMNWTRNSLKFSIQVAITSTVPPLSVFLGCSMGE